MNGLTFVKGKNEFLRKEFSRSLPGVVVSSINNSVWVLFRSANACFGCPAKPDNDAALPRTSKQALTLLPVNYMLTKYTNATKI